VTSGSTSSYGRETHTGEAFAELGRFVASFEWEDADEGLREQLYKTLLDTAGVMIAGARTGEVRALVEAWDPDAGPAHLFGGGKTTVDAAAYLNGISAVALELDEGNKYAKGHPASHAFPAALAVAQARRASGSELAAALVVGHELASRFGRATRLDAGVHPHGNWGVVGAAAAASRLMGLDAEATASALDGACGLALATPWESALHGNPVRNAWVGAANFSGIVAARMASASVARVTGTPEASLGRILGEFEPAELTEELGSRFDLGNAYFKRHASCSYTHPPADAVLAILEQRPDLDPGRVSSILVETYRVAATLNLTECRTRLAAMFSVPYVVAAALSTGNCRPEAFDEERRTDLEIRRLMSLTSVAATEEFDRGLPEKRGARVTVELQDGATFAAEVPNPVGDADYRPFGLEEIRGKLEVLLGPLGVEVEKLETAVRGLLSAEDVGRALERFP
jgi:2-methylcitrate dehydratase PrpD